MLKRTRRFRQQWFMPTAVAVVASMPSVALSATVTWTGAAGDGFWFTANNWDTLSPPDDGDDVILANGDTITVNVGSAFFPDVIASFTIPANATGAGGLIFPTNTGLQVNGDFTNNSTHKFDITMQAGSKLDIADGSLIETNVTMTPVPTGTPTELNVAHEIVGGDYTISERCNVIAGRIPTGVIYTAPLSILEGDWVISDNADVRIIGDMVASSSDPVSLTIEDASKLTIERGLYGRLFATNLPNILLYGNGGNILETGPDTDDPNMRYLWEFGRQSSMSTLTNTAELTMISRYARKLWIMTA